MKIYKYELKLEDDQVIEANVIQFLSVQFQNGKLYLWALVDTTLFSGITPRHLIKIITTGDSITNARLSTHEFLTTFQLHGGSFVGHVFVPKL